MDDLTLVVPAAGLGTRLASVSARRPKCLLPLDGRPILCHVLDTGLLLPAHRIVIVVNSEDSPIVREIGARYAGVPVFYVVQDKALGLAHAVTRAEPYVRHSMLVINADEIYVDSCHAGAWNEFAARDAEAMVGYLHSSDPGVISTGYALTLSPDGRVLHLEEKPRHPWNDLLGVGTWLLRRSWFEAYRETEINPVRGERDFVAVIQTIIGDGGLVCGFDLGGRFYNINTAADLERAHREVTGPWSPVSVQAAT